MFFHVNIVMLHVEIVNLHVKIFILHVEIFDGKKKLAHKGQRYATKWFTERAACYVFRPLSILFLTMFEYFFFYKTILQLYNVTLKCLHFLAVCNNFLVVKCFFSVTRTSEIDTLIWLC